MDYTSTQTITEKYKVVKYAIPAIVTTHKRVVTMVRMTVVNITGILIPDSCLYPKKGWSTSSEKSGQHHKNRWSRWIGIYMYGNRRYLCIQRFGNKRKNSKSG